MFLNHVYFKPYTVKETDMNLDGSSKSSYIKP